VNGDALVFGNQGGLFMNAMTWWDHGTLSVWSQPWGRAIAGPLKGAELELIPSQLAPWKTWREAHPDTLALKAAALGNYHPEGFTARYVIGVALGGAATAFPYELAERAGVINDDVGPYPIAVYVDGETQGVHVYLRQVDEQVLTFNLEESLVRDSETGSTWRMDRGVAVDGPLQGQALRPAPYIPAFSRAWRDFYPHSRWYGED
jgi:hypothetical protein